MVYHLHTGTRAADGGIDWVPEPKVKILYRGDNESEACLARLSYWLER
jgi:hypothetical protein